MDVLSRFYSREDFHQSIEYAAVMEAIGWSSIPIHGSRIAVHQLGPVSLAKMQRPLLIDCPRLFTLQSRLRMFRLIIEPGVTGTLVDGKKKAHQFSFVDTVSAQKALSLFKEVGFHLSGQRYAHSKTAILDIAGPIDEIVKHFPAKTRYNIKISNRVVNTYEIDRFDVLSDEKKERFFALHTAWSTAQKIHGFSNSFLGHVITHFPKKGWMISSTTNGAYSGGMMILIHDNVAYYFYTFTTAQGKVTHVPTGLVFKAIELAKENGADIFDFCSVYDDRYPKDNPRWKGFSEFKSRFAPISVTYPPSFSR